MFVWAWYELGCGTLVEFQACVESVSGRSSSRTFFPNLSGGRKTVAFAGQPKHEVSENVQDKSWGDGVSCERFPSFKYPSAAGSVAARVDVSRRIACMVLRSGEMRENEEKFFYEVCSMACVGCVVTLQIVRATLWLNPLSVSLLTQPNFRRGLRSFLPISNPPLTTRTVHRES